MSTDPFGILGSLLEGRYRVERVAGEGGFGVVYKAFHVRFEAPVAIKVLKLPGGASAEQRAAFLEAFRAEGKLLFELSSLHESIVQATETGAVVAPDGAVAPFLVLEWLEGVSLERELRYRKEHAARPFTLPEVIALLAPAVEALAMAHAKGIAHRDIKPGNIFLARKGDRVVAKILDFGLAKVAIDSGSTTAMFAQTSDFRLPFTPAYGTPEQFIRRLGATGPWTDTFALALVLVEMLTGEHALGGSDPAQYMGSTADEAVRPTPRARGLDLGDEIEDVFLRALQVDPRERFREARSFWDALCTAAGWTASPEQLPPELQSAPTAPPPAGQTSRPRVSERHGPTGSTLPETGSLGLTSFGTLPEDSLPGYVGARRTHSAGLSSRAPRRAIALVVAALMAALAAALIVMSSRRLPEQPRGTSTSASSPLENEEVSSVGAPPTVVASSSAPIASADPQPPTLAAVTVTRPSVPPRRTGPPKRTEETASVEPPQPTASAMPSSLPSPSSTEIPPDEVLEQRR